ncbi:MAG: hypothetical protein HUU55_09950 [Myxococcales bacterium]|nr:hypothetical protein [Myxococcales bacterium]
MAQKTEKHANIRVEIDGKTAFETNTAGGTVDTFSGIHITRLHVDKRMDSPDMFTLDYDLIVRTGMTFVDSIVEGKAVKIQIAYGPTSNLKPVFTGEISHVEPHFTNRGYSRLTISGYDRSHRLTRGTSMKSWDNRTTDAFDYTGIASDIIQKSGNHDGSKLDGLAIGQTGNSESKFRHVPQLAVNNWQFLKSLGVDVGLKPGSENQDDKQIGFRQVTVGAEKLTICRDKPDGTNPHIAHEVRFRLNTVKQVSRVEVRGWNPQTKKNIVGVAESPSLSFGGTPGHEATAKALYDGGPGKKFVVVDHPVYSKDEAKKVAQALFDQLSMDFVTGEAEIEGDPELAPGDVVAVLGFGKRFDGKYLVTACQHVYIPEVTPYVCRLELSRNSINDA